MRHICLSLSIFALIGCPSNDEPRPDAGNNPAADAGSTDDAGPTDGDAGPAATRENRLATPAHN